MVVSSTYWLFCVVILFILFTLLVLFVCGCVQHVLAFLCCIFVYLIYVISVVCVWLCLAHIVFCVLYFCLSYLRY